MGMRPATKLSVRRWDPSGWESKLLTKMLREIRSVKRDYAKHTQSSRKLERVVEADVTSLGRFVRKQRGLHLQVFGCAQRADDMGICLRVNAFTMDLVETRLRAVLPVETFDRVRGCRWHDCIYLQKCNALVSDIARVYPIVLQILSVCRTFMSPAALASCRADTAEVGTSQNTGYLKGTQEVYKDPFDRVRGCRWHDCIYLQKCNALVSDIARVYPIVLQILSVCRTFMSPAALASCRADTAEVGTSQNTGSLKGTQEVYKDHRRILHFKEPFKALYGVCLKRLKGYAGIGSMFSNNPMIGLCRSVNFKKERTTQVTKKQARSETIHIFCK